MENLKSEAPDNKVDVESLAVFKQGKLVGYASLQEVRYLLFIQNKIKTTTLSANCKDNKKFTYEITHSKTDVTAKEKKCPSFSYKN